jgi:hypothetical protein
MTPIEIAKKIVTDPRDTEPGEALVVAIAYVKLLTKLEGLVEWYEDDDTPIGAPYHGDD